MNIEKKYYKLVSDRSYVSLRCDVRGTPPPVITWSKVGGIIDLNDRHRLALPNGDLILTGLTPQTMESFSGIYICAGNNAVGYDQEKVVGKFVLRMVSSKWSLEITEILSCSNHSI